MTRKSERTRRRQILVAGLLLSMLGVAGIFIAARIRERRQRAELRSNGFAALQAHDYERAASDLGQYVTVVSTDPAAMYAYATAVRGLGWSEPGNLPQAIAALRRVSQMQPTNATASRELLDLTTLGGFNSEAIELADRVLSIDGRDADALWNRAVAEMRLRHFKDAVADARNLNSVQPSHLDGQLLTMELMRLTHAPADQIVARAEAAAKEIGSEAGREIVRGFARQITGDRAAALQRYREAVGHLRGDGDLARRLIGLLDAAGGFADATAALQEAVRLKPADLPLKRQLSQRLNQTGRPDLVLELTGETGETARDDTELLVSRGIALLQLRRSSELDGVADRLSHRLGACAGAWAAVFTSLLQPSTAGLDVQLQVLKQQTARLPNDAMLRLMLANALAASGQLNDASMMFEQVSRLAPAWGAPLARRAELLLDQRQASLALVSARQALDRDPQNPSYAAIVARAWSASASPSEPVPAALLELAKQVNRAAPQDPGGVIALARLYLRSNDRASAEQLLDQALHAHPNAKLIRAAANFYGAMNNVTVATDWLEKTSASLPADAYSERIELARAWHLLARQHQREDFLDRAQSILQSVSSDPHAPAIAFTSLATLKNARGDHRGAEHAYRAAAMCVAPDPFAQNNLAMLLNDQQRDGVEAQKLASAAVAACPYAADFRDTLAKAQLRQGQTECAIESWKRALALVPANADWHLRLAEAYATIHDVKHAREASGEAEALARAVGQLPADFYDRLSHLRQQLIATRA